jgi:hypothetical protein
VGPSRHFAGAQQFSRFRRAKRTFSETRLHNRIYEYLPYDTALKKAADAGECRAKETANAERTGDPNT